VPPVEVSPRGTISVSDRPGFGYDLDRDLLERLTVRRQTLFRSTLS
jgi:L-alanine-DL-glutamate epimerase-like enolase superfamily enzyme